MDYINDNNGLITSPVLITEIGSDIITQLSLDTGNLMTLSPPSVPNSLSGVASVGGTSVTLRWSVPLVTGSSPIGYYKVYKVTSGVYTLQGTTTNLYYTITELSKYTSYTFAVQAVNTESLTSGYVSLSLNSACFKEGTKILYWNEEKQKEEYIPIEKLSKGMKVKTSLDGYLPIELIGYSTIHNSVKEFKNKDGLYKLEKDVYPELFEDLYMTGAHSILVPEITDEERNDILNMLGDIYVTDQKYRLPISLDIHHSQPYNEVKEFTIWHLALENSSYYGNYGIYANGLLVETSIVFVT